MRCTGAHAEGPAELGRWKEGIAQGMEVGGPGVLLKGETGCAAMRPEVYARRLTQWVHKVKSQTTAEGVVVWRVE